MVISMASSHSITLLTLVQAWISDSWLERVIHDHTFSQRDRKIDPVFFIMTLILGWNSGSTRSIASLHRAYQRALGCDCDRSAFYKRFTSKLVAVLDQMWLHLTRGPDGDTRLGPFADILALDATIIALWSRLADRLPAYRQGQAAHKLQLLISLKNYTPNRMLLDAGTSSDHEAWTMLGPWLKDKLVLCDLGYHKFWFFHRIHAHGGFFLTRLKKNSALRIVQDLSQGPGRRKPLTGMSFSEALKGMRRQLVECVVEVPVTLRSGRKIIYRWRAIAEWNTEQKRYHTYLTNCPDHLIKASEAPGLYALRWQVELMFKGLKSVGRLHHLPSTKAVVVEALIKAALLFVLLSGWLREALCHAEKLSHVGILRMLGVLREWASHLHAQLGATRPRYKPVDELDLFTSQLRDPNIVRARSMLTPCLVDYFP
jgi:putative transposase